jgi:hypothetical protein
MSTPKTPEILDKIVDAVLAYKPDPKTDAGKARKRKASKAKRAPKNLGANSSSSSQLDKSP